MKRIAAARYRFSPSDLINYVRSEFITWMDRFYLDHPGEAEPDPDTEEMQIVQDKGIEHEFNFLADLKAAGRGVTDFGSQKEHLQATLSAMRRGDEIIYQGYLVRDEFRFAASSSSVASLLSKTGRNLATRIAIKGFACPELEF